MLWDIFVSSNFVVEIFSFALKSYEAIYAILRRGFLRVRLNGLAGAERELLDKDVDAVSCPGASVALSMDTVLCMPFSLMANIWSLTLMIGKVPIVLGIRLLYVVLATSSASLTEEVTNCGSSM